MYEEEAPKFAAPRLHTLLSRLEGRRILVWDRETWNSLKPDFGEPVTLDVSLTPLASVAEEASFLAAAAQEVSSTGLGLAIYRYDPQDPKPFNVDRYGVWENIPARYDFETIVNQASTTIDANLEGFLETNVFVVQLDKGPGHWLSEGELPAQVKVVIREASEDAG